MKRAHTLRRQEGWIPVGLKIIISDQVKEGSYFLIAFADAKQVLSESNETNNYSSLAVTLVKKTLDIQPYIIKDTPFLVGKGQTFVPTVNVLSNGNFYADSIYLSYYLSSDTVADSKDIFLHETLIEGVNYYFSSDKPSLKIPENTPNGQYYLLAIADERNIVKESNETNNVSKAKLTVGSPYTDLAINEFRLTGMPSMDEPFPGGTFATYTFITNKGNTAVSGIKVKNYISNDSILTADDKLYAVIENGPGTLDDSIFYAAYKIPKDAKPGKVYLISQLTYNEDSSDVNPGNSKKFLELEIENKRVELALHDLTIEGATTTPGSKIIPHLFVTSESNFIVDYQIRFYLSNDTTFDNTDALIYSENTTAYPGRTHTISPVLTLDTQFNNGTYTLIAVAQAGSNIKEANVKNNTVKTKLVLEDRNTDLTLTIPKDTVLYSLPGDYFHLNFKENNKGTTYAPGHYIGYYLSKDTILDKDDVEIYATNYSIGIDGDRSLNINGWGEIYAQTLPGNYFLLISADKGNSIEETNENNNIGYVRLVVKSKNPDLTIYVTGTIPAIVKTGETIPFQAVEFNNSGTPAGDHYISYFLSSDSIFDQKDIFLSSIYIAGSSDTKPVNVNSSVGIPRDISPGVYYLHVYSDYGNKVAENNENNNISTITLFVGNEYSKSDLAISNAGSDKNEVFAGDDLKVFATEVNKSNVPFELHHVGFYLSKDSTLSPDDYDLGIVAVYPGGGNSSSVDLNVNIPAGTLPGAYFVIAQADAEKIIKEWNEENNSKPFSIIVKGDLVAGLENSVSSASVSVYPNPTSGEVKVSGLNAADILEVTNISGTTIITKQVSNIQEVNLNLSGLSSGFYIVKLKKSEAVTATQRIVVK